LFSGRAEHPDALVELVLNYGLIIETF